jgi:hypothetical protein
VGIEAGSGLLLQKGKAKYRSKPAARHHFSSFSAAFPGGRRDVEVALATKISDNAGFGRSARRVLCFLYKRLLRHGAARYNRRLSPSSTIFLEILWSLFV